MISKNIKFVHISLSLVFSFALSSCGGTGEEAGFDGSTTTTTPEGKQAIAQIAVDSITFFDLMSLVVTTADSIKSYESSAAPLSCQQGSGLMTVINNEPIDSFGSGDLVLISARNCMGTDGINRNGEFSVSGDGSRLVGEFRNYGTQTDSLLNGIITVIPTSNYNPQDGTGSLQVSVDALEGIEKEKVTTFKDGSYQLMLSANSYTYTIDHKVISNQFEGIARIKTTNQGLFGNTRFNDNRLVVSSPISGEMIVEFPDGNTGEIFVNNGDSSSYDLRIDGGTSTVGW